MEHNQLENNLIKFDFHYVLISKIAGPRGLHPLQAGITLIQSQFSSKRNMMGFDLYFQTLEKGYSILEQHSNALYILQNGNYMKTFHPFSSWLCSHKLMLIFSNCQESGVDGKSTFTSRRFATSFAK